MYSFLTKKKLITYYIIRISTYARWYSSAFHTTYGKHTKSDQHKCQWAMQAGGTVSLTATEGSWTKKASYWWTSVAKMQATIEMCIEIRGACHGKPNNLLFIHGKPRVQCIIIWLIQWLFHYHPNKPRIIILKPKELLQPKSRDVFFNARLPSFWTRNGL